MARTLPMGRKQARTRRYFKVDRDGNVSDEEIDRFVRELGLPETKD